MTSPFFWTTACGTPWPSASRACSARCRASPWTGTTISGRTHLYISISSGRPGWPETWTCAWRLGDDLHAEVGQLVHDPADRDLVAGDDPRREDDRVAVGQLELVRCPTAIRPSAARGSPCPPVAMISTSLARQAHRLVEADRRAGNRADSRSPGRRARMRSSERPATHTLRPVSRATRPMVCSRAALEAKVVTSTRPLAFVDLREQPCVDALLRARRLRPGRRWSNRTPARARRDRRSRSAPRCSAPRRAPASRRSSSRRCGRCCRTAFRSAGRCPRGSSATARRS